MAAVAKIISVPRAIVSCVNVFYFGDWFILSFVGFVTAAFRAVTKGVSLAIMLWYQLFLVSKDLF